MIKLDMTIAEKEQEIIEEFGLFDDWMGKYEWLIELGKTLPLVDEKFKTDENLIHGCQSKVWLHANQRDGLVYFSADSDAVITKGIVNLLISVLSGHHSREIIDAPLTFIDKIGLKEHLSITRSNGLLAMIKQMKMYALAFESSGDN